MFTRKPDGRDGQTVAYSDKGLNVLTPMPLRSEPPPRAEPRRPIIDVAANSPETIISSDLTIVGNVISKGRVRLEGTIEGDMHCASLEVSRSGAVTGTIVAEEVAVYGKVAGTVRGNSVTLYASAHVEGDIFHKGIGIEMGTHYDGRLKWAENPTANQNDS